MFRLCSIKVLILISLSLSAQDPFWEMLEIPESIKYLKSIAVNDSGHLFLGACPHDGDGGGVYRWKVKDMNGSI